MRQNKRNTTAILATAALGIGLTAGGASVHGAAWTGTAADGDWANPVNWSTNPAPAPGNASGTTTSTTDDATFGAATNLQVNPDPNRRIRNLAFAADAGNYIIGPASGANTLYLQGNITGSNASTITFNSPIRTIGNSGITTATGQVLNFEGLYSLAHGQTQGVSGSGTVNFDGGFSSTNVTPDARANINIGETTVVNFNTASPALQRVGISMSSSGTVNLNASHVIFGDTGNGGPGNRAYNLQTGGSGTVNVNAADALHGSASVWAGNATSGTTSVVTINHDQANTGRLSTGTNAGVGFGTLLGNVGYVSGNSVNGPDIGADGFTNATGATAVATLLVNNNAANGTGHSTAGGSATGNSDVNIVTGLLGGNGFIANTDVTIGSTTYEQGVTLHKRTNTSNNTVTYGKLSPGATAGAIGTLTMDLGSKGLNIAAAVSDAATQTLLFDLDSIANSDRVSLLNDTVLNIGAGGLELDDFVFTTASGFGAGVYTLFDTNALIGGTLGSNVTGTLGGFDVQLAFADGNQDVVLLVGTAVPEPATFVLLAMGGLGLLARRRRA